MASETYNIILANEFGKICPLAVRRLPWQAYPETATSPVPPPRVDPGTFPIRRPSGCISLRLPNTSVVKRRPSRCSTITTISLPLFPQPLIRIPNLRTSRFFSIPIWFSVDEERPFQFPLGASLCLLVKLVLFC
jgi:hypothetical protein